MPHALACARTNGASESTPLSSSSKTPERAGLNESTNVILAYRMHEVKHLSAVNFVLALLTLVYVGVNIFLFVLNYMDKNDDPCGDPDDVRVARCGSPASDLVFHRVEFCSSFVYACVEAAALAYTPRAISSISRRPMLLRMPASRGRDDFREVGKQ